MSHDKKAEQTRNPTELLQDQVILLHDVRSSLVQIQTTQVHIAKALKDIYQLTYEISEAREELADVEVVDSRMSFGAMVVFMIKWTIAAIPVGIFFAVVVWLLISLLGVTTSLGFDAFKIAFVASGTAVGIG